MCFVGPVRVLLLQSTEQVQGLWLLLLQLRHWFQEGSRAELLLQLSVVIKEGEGKILASPGVCTTKTNFRVRDNAQPTAAAVTTIPNVPSSALLAQPMWSVRASLRDPDTHPVFLPSLGILFISVPVFLPIMHRKRKLYRLVYLLHFNSLNYLKEIYLKPNNF